MPTSELQALPEKAVLFDGASCGLLLTDASGLIRQVNKSFCAWIGYESSALVDQRKFQDLLTMGGRIFCQTHLAPLLHMQGSVAELKLEIVAADRTTIPIVMNAVRRQHGEGVFDEISVFVARDRHKYERELLQERSRAQELLASERNAQSELQLSQARLRLALRAAQLSIWDVDLATGSRRYDDDASLLLGYAVPGPVDEQMFRSSMTSADAAREAEIFNRALHNPRETYECSYDLKGVDGKTRVVSALGRSVFDSAGTLIRFVGVLRDITEQALVQVASEERALLSQQMIGIVSHDLRNPLSAIQTAAQLLERTGLTATQVRVMGHLNNATARANRLIADLLDFTQAKLGAGLKIDAQSCSLHDVISRSVDELTLAFPGHDFRIVFGDLGHCVVDPDRIQQLVGNLVANAVAYGAPGRPITVMASVHGGGFKVSVHNEGSTIPATILPTLFDPMTRGTQVPLNTRSVGLGLFIVRELVRAHGGTISVESGDAEGTTFTADFPSRQMAL